MLDQLGICLLVRVRQVLKGVAASVGRAAQDHDVIFTGGELELDVLAALEVRVDDFEPFELGPESLTEVVS